jgi:uncharacterized protein (DUF302 family)
MTATEQIDNDWVERVNPAGFEATVQHLTQAITAAGLQVFATIDHAQAARSAGLSMPRTIVILYGSPKAGTPVMTAHPNAALDLPLRVLVREHSDDSTVVAFHAIVLVLSRLGVGAEVARRLQPAQQLLLTALAA